MKVILKAFMPQGQEETPKGKHVGDNFTNIAHHHTRLFHSSTIIYDLESDIS
jgi:hypothetical protein